MLLVVVTKTDIPKDTYASLCEKCSVLSVDLDTLEPEFEHLTNDLTIWKNLQYDQTDTLPDLPLLKAAATAGCTFCAVLCSATRGLHLPISGDIKCRMRYILYPEDFGRSDRYGVQRLDVHITEVHRPFPANFACSNFSFTVNYNDMRWFSVQMYFSLTPSATMQNREHERWHAVKMTSLYPTSNENRYPQELLPPSALLKQLRCKAVVNPARRPFTWILAFRLMRPSLDSRRVLRHCLPSHLLYYSKKSDR